MKKILYAVIAVTLAFLTAFISPVRALAAAEKVYISEVRVGMGGDAKSYLEAEGFTVLCDEKGNPIDLNQGAGGGWGSHGDKKVLLGYKTTTDISEAVTDLAVMNMNGGYSVKEYEALLDGYVSAQISPFLDRFMVTINEYRENVKSADDQNKARAEYVRAALNMFTDDDCGGAPLGDLLLNETVYEMAKPEYDRLSAEEKKDKSIGKVNAQVRSKLSDAEKNKHCDILTLFAQADGQVMLTIYALLTRAADTADDSWVDRFAGITYDDLLDSYDMTPTDAERAAARDFEDDAKTLLTNWEDFRSRLLSSPGEAEYVLNSEMPDLAGAVENVEALNDQSSEKEVIEVLAQHQFAQTAVQLRTQYAADAAIALYLDSYEYDFDEEQEGETLYDFFTQSSVDVANQIEMLFPLISVLSPGQRAGFEFLSIREFVLLANRDTDYSTDNLQSEKQVSVYEGVNREIYKKGGVALTSDALRTDALEKDTNLADRSILSTKTVVLWMLTGASAIGFIAAVASMGAESAKASLSANVAAVSTMPAADLDTVTKQLSNLVDVNWAKDTFTIKNPEMYDKLTKRYTELCGEKFNPMNDVVDINPDEISNGAAENSRLMASSGSAAKWMAVGMAAVTVIIAAISAYMTWQDLKNYYKVDFTPIPHYMVDETSITYINDKNEKVFKKNQAAYYEAVRCNRTKDDGFDGKRFEMMDNCADLNGDVGQQWLALYVCKDSDSMQPILADSLKVVVGSSEIPAGYDNRGIHMFGSESAFNLNSKLYDWNQSAKSVFVYFKPDTSVTPGASTAGSAFSTGTIALVGIGSAALGSVITAYAVMAFGKRKKAAAAA